MLHFSFKAEKNDVNQNTVKGDLCWSVYWL